jgi:hypothetical protein
MSSLNIPPEHRPLDKHLDDIPPNARHLVWGFAGLAIVLAGAALGTFEYAQHQHRQMERIVATNESLNASLTAMQEQLSSVTERLTQRIEAENAARATPPPPAPAPVVRAARKPAPQPVEAVPPKDPRVDVLQGELADQQKALASTREDLDPSVAHTHDELVALEKRGQHNYFEFSLNKSKEFQKVGPLSLELRRVDFKHKSYDVSLLVDDFTLQKKKVNLYEPVWITLNDAPEPVQLIVNQIDKDKISGYIAAPKYRKSELDRTASAAAAPPTAVQ